VLVQSKLKRAQIVLNFHTPTKTKQTTMPNAPTTQRKQLTDLQKGAILALKEEKKSQRSIAEKLKIPRPTIENFLKRFRIHGTHENLP